MSEVEFKKESLSALSGPAAQAIPLPVDVPPPPRLADVPPRILHSATVETLIDHADDLSSRLKVHIRRNGALEGQIIELEEQIQESEAMRQTLLAQVAILREKDRSLADKQAAADGRFNRVAEELEISRMESKELRRRNLELQTSNARAQAYERRVQRWVRPGFQKRAQATRTMQARIDSFENEVVRLHAVVSGLREELSHQKTEADRRITNVDRDRARLVEQYEKQVAKIQEEKSRIETDLARANERVETLDRATNDGARANNERVYFERRAEELEARLRSETERLQGSLDDLANECSALRASAQTARDLREQSDASRIDAEAARHRSEVQLQGLREIWQETSLRLQALESQNEALEKLNAELSRKLTETRERERTRLGNDSLNRVGFIEPETTAREAKLRKLDTILTDMEMKAFGITPPSQP